MKSDADAITDDEWLFRRVHRTKFRSEKSPFVSPGAFEPRLPDKSRAPDTDGISLYREACLADAAQCLQPVLEESRSDWGVVRVNVSDLRKLGLSVTSVKDEAVPGHVVIPEMSAGEFNKNRDLCKKQMHDSL
jgi:hypothetical protein